MLMTDTIGWWVSSCMLDENYWMKVCCKVSTLSLADRDIWDMCRTVNTKKPVFEQRGSRFKHIGRAFIAFAMLFHPSGDTAEKAGSRPRARSSFSWNSITYSWIRRLAFCKYLRADLKMILLEVEESRESQW